MYEDVFERLERDRVRYVVVGGVAMVLHGCVRATRDLDLVVDRSPAEAARATHALMSLGFVPTIPLPLAELVVLSMLDREHRAIDVFARFQIPFAELWERSELVRVGEGVARVASIPDLIREKRIYGHPRDLLDVESLLALPNRG